jgi:hypothetical protein
MMHINLMEERHTIQIQSDPINFGMVLTAWVATMFGLAVLLYLGSVR